MTTIDQHRDVDGAVTLLGLTSELLIHNPGETVAERESALQDAWTLLDRAAGHPHVPRLRGVVREMQGNLAEAVDFLYEAVRSGDVSALIRLEALLRLENRNGEADHIADRITEEIDSGNAEVMGAMLRDMSFADIPESLDPERLQARAASAGSQYAQIERALLAIELGEPDSLDQFRALSDDPDAAAMLGRHMWRFQRLYGLLNDEEPTESYRLVRAAHDQGSIEATIWLWLHTEAPDDQEFVDILESRFLSGDRAHHIAAVLSGGPGRALAELAQSALDEGNELLALRLFQAAVTAGSDEAVGALGSLLKSEAADEGPWAVLGAFLSAWPQALSLDLVGTPNFPLSVAMRTPALRDDHSAALAIEESDFARRIQEVLEQVGWQVQALGDHLLVGYWRVESAPLQIYIEISGGVERDQAAHFSTPLLVGIPQNVKVPWGAPETPSSGEPGWDFALEPEVRANTTHIGAYAASFLNVQRRVIEGLFRIGENDSREYYLQPMGFLGLTLGGMLGRRMTFDGTPDRLYPQAWASLTPCDYISSALIHEVPELHKCDGSIELLNVGYTLGAGLSGGHLRGVIGGVVHSLMTMQDYLTRMFDDEPSIFEEFFHAIPMTRILDHRPIFEGRIPDIEASVRGGPSRLQEAFAGITEQQRRIASDPNADPLAINNAAHTVMMQGLHEEGLAGFELAASMGQPNALASLIWFRLLGEDFEQARGAFERYFPRVPGWMQGQDEDIQAGTYDQLANCKSNAALAYLALGDRRQALQLWSEAADVGHIEAKAYPGVLAVREGEMRQAKKIFKRLSKSELQEFIDDMESVHVEGTGWFRDWARDALRAVGSSQHFN
jgi:hypothetical protein